MLDEYLSRAIRGRSERNFYPASAEPGDGDGYDFLVTLWDENLSLGVVVSLTAGPGSPEQRALYGRRPHTYANKPMARRTPTRTRSVTQAEGEAAGNISGDARTRAATAEVGLPCR